MWCFVAQAFSGPVVEEVLGQGYLIVGHFFQLAVLGKELTDQAIEVFVGAAFPGGVRMGEVEVQLERGGDPLMLGKLFAIIGGQGMSQMGKRSEFCDDGLAYDRGLFTDYTLNQHIAALAFVDGHQRL